MDGFLSNNARDAIAIVGLALGVLGLVATVASVARSSATSPASIAVGRGGTGPVPGFGLYVAKFLMFFFGFTMLAGIAIHNTWLWTISPYLLIEAARLHSFARRHLLVRANISRMMMPRLTVLWLGLWFMLLLEEIGFWPAIPHWSE